MDYGSARDILAADRAAQTLNTKSVALDDVERFANAVEAQTRLVGQFCERFFSGPACGSDEACRPVPSGYNGQLQRLGGAIDDLTKAVQRLSEIG